MVGWGEMRERWREKRGRVNESIFEREVSVEGGGKMNF